MGVNVFVSIGMKNNPARTPGRPRSFDADSALDAATQVFWSRGYSDASLDDLTGAMGISRPSLYGAFGDKQALYLKCIERYRGWVEGAIGAALQDSAHPRASLLKMFSDAITLYTTPAPEPRGCLLASASLSEAALSQVSRNSITQALATVETALGDFFRRSGLADKLAGERAQLTATFLYGISSRARLGVAAQTLLDDAGRFVDLLA
jgi:TetR/AcrR family transcriptional regulator, copper-responsive repressor